jgi:hypothetical protein
VILRPLDENVPEEEEEEEGESASASTSAVTSPLSLEFSEGGSASGKKGKKNVPFEIEGEDADA